MTTQQDAAIINIITTLRNFRAIDINCEVICIHSDNSADVMFFSGRTKYNATVGPKGALYTTDGKIKSPENKILAAVYRDWDAA